MMNASNNLSIFKTNYEALNDTRLSNLVMSLREANTHQPKQHDQEQDQDQASQNALPIKIQSSSKSHLKIELDI